MYPIRAGQIKAARAILGLSQEDLALAAQLSVATIRNIEQGNYPRSATINLVRAALERAGIEFTDCDGVKRRVEDIELLQGHCAGLRFCEDIFKNADEDGVIAISKSQKMLMASLGLETDRPMIEELNGIQNAKCLLSELPVPGFTLPPFELRTIPRFHVGPTCYFVYGDRYAVVVTEDNQTFRHIVFKSPALAHGYRAEFLSLWNMAFPLTADTAAISRRMIA